MTARATAVAVASVRCRPSQRLGALARAHGRRRLVRRRAIALHRHPRPVPKDSGPAARVPSPGSRWPRSARAHLSWRFRAAASRPWQLFRGCVRHQFLRSGATRQEGIERRSQAVDITALANLIETALGLLGAHVGGRAERQPICVPRSDPDAGRSVPSPEPISVRPMIFANPQSTSNVSPNLPSKMLAGLRSR